MNKNTKIRLNYLIGIAISALLLWSIWLQVNRQLSQIEARNWWQGGLTAYLVIALILMPLNLGTEALKWKLLAGAAQPLSYMEALKSLLAGLVLSLVTPNRIGEYPGRIIYLRRKNTVRLVSVSILGASAQFLTLFIFGIAALCYYNIVFPGYWQKLILSAAILVLIIIAILFFSFETWVVYFEKIKWLRRFHTYGQLMRRFTIKEQLTVLGLSMFRFCLFTAQYLALLHWMNIELTAAQGFFTASLFFWSMAVIPSVALAELGIRGQVSLFLFHHFTNNTMGILGATIGLWCINLIIPAIFGSILLIRLKLLR